MKLTWQIVRKDLYKLRIPLAIWLGFMMVQVGFNMAVSGFFGPPNWNGLALVAPGVEGCVRFLINPLAAYLFASWIVFADPLVERDAFWITRPISGWRLLAAKLTAAGLVFFVLPVVASLPWWLACGLGAKDILLGAILQHGPLLAVALVGMTMAAITDGFPRYVLWTIAGAAVAAVIQMTVAWASGARHVSFNLNASRAAFTLVLAAVVFGAVLLHQFVTRRLRRSICLLVAGLVVAIVTGSLSRWDLGPLVAPAPVQAQQGDEKISVRSAGPAVYFAVSPTRPARVMIPIRIDGLPDEVMRWVSARAEWSWNGRKEWSATGVTWSFLPSEAIRRLKRLPLSEGPMQVAIPLSPVLAERMKREPPSFHSALDIRVHRGAIKIEMSPRNQTVRNELGSFSLSNVHEANGVLSADFTWRQFGPNLPPFWFNPWRFSSWLGGVAMVRRSDGAMVIPISKSTFNVNAFLDSALVVAYHWEFHSPADSHWFDDADLVLVGYDEGRVIKRTLDIDPFQLVEASAPAR
jgi:hypothetical protein